LTFFNNSVTTMNHRVTFFVTVVACLACLASAGGDGGGGVLPQSCKDDRDNWKTCMNKEMNAQGVSINMSRGEQCFEKCQHQNPKAQMMNVMHECVKNETSVCVMKAVPFNVIDGWSGGGGGGQGRRHGGGSRERDEKSFSQTVSDIIAHAYAHCGVITGDCIRQTIPAAVVDDAGDDAVARKFCDANAKCKPSTSSSCTNDRSLLKAAMCSCNVRSAIERCHSRMPLPPLVQPPRAGEQGSGRQRQGQGSGSPERDHHQHGPPDPCAHDDEPEDWFKTPSFCM